MYDIYFKFYLFKSAAIIFFYNILSYINSSSVLSLSDSLLSNNIDYNLIYRFINFVIFFTIIFISIKIIIIINI